MGTAILGLITGRVFGFFPQKGQALRYDKQLYGIGEEKALGYS